MGIIISVVGTYAMVLITFLIRLFINQLTWTATSFFGEEPRVTASTGQAFRIGDTHSFLVELPVLKDLAILVASTYPWTTEDLNFVYAFRHHKTLNHLQSKI